MESVVFHTTGTYAKRRTNYFVNYSNVALVDVARFQNVENGYIQCQISKHIVYLDDGSLDCISLNVGYCIPHQKPSKQVYIYFISFQIIDSNSEW